MGIWRYIILRKKVFFKGIIYIYYMKKVYVRDILDIRY